MFHKLCSEIYLCIKLPLFLKSYHTWNWSEHAVVYRVHTPLCGFKTEYILKHVGTMYPPRKVPLVLVLRWSGL